MVGVVAAPVSEYVRGYFRNFAGSSSISGTSWRKCRDSCRYDRSSEHRQRFRKSVLGLGIRFAHTTSDVHRNVRGPGGAVLRPSEMNSANALSVVAFLILMCYGGGFGTMPAFAADYFGSRNVGPIYGLMLTAWGFASGFGPLLIAYMRQTTGSYRGALHVIGGDYGTFDALAFRCSSTKTD